MRTTIALLLSSLAFITTPVMAEWPNDALTYKGYKRDAYWSQFYCGGRYRPEGCEHYRRRRYYAHHHRYVPQPVVPHIGSQHCPGTIINVVSGERQGEDKAKGDARKLFMGEASTRHGLAYAALEYAKHVRWRCFPAQAHDTWAGALSKGANKIMGGDGQNVRCELWASPCSVPVQGD